MYIFYTFYEFFSENLRTWVFFCYFTQLKCECRRIGVEKIQNSTSRSSSLLSSGTQAGIEQNSGPKSQEPSFLSLEWLRIQHTPEKKS